MARPLGAVLSPASGSAPRQLTAAGIKKRNLCRRRRRVDKHFYEFAVRNFVFDVEAGNLRQSQAEAQRQEVAFRTGDGDSRRQRILMFVASPHKAQRAELACGEGPHADDPMSLKRL